MTKTLVNSASKFALLGGTAVALALSASVSAQAASMVDRGLERRVSDLEAEVRLLKNRVKALEDRKLAVPDRIVLSGNSRVKVTLYGQVNRAVRFHFAQNDAGIHNVDNDASSSRIGILARGRLFPDLTISARTEVEWQENRRSFTGDPTEGIERIRARHVDLWFTHADLGTLWMGHGSTASDAASLFTLSGTSIVFAMHGGADDAGIFLNNGPTGQVTGRSNLVGGNLLFTGRRENRIMYTSPRIAGFEFRVSHAEGDAIDAGIRYAGSPFGLSDIRVLGAFGYQYSPTAGSLIPGFFPSATNPAGAPGLAYSAYAASGGILHVPTGLNINGSWTFATPLGNNPVGVHNIRSWYVEGGWQGKVWAMGKSYWSIGGGRFDGGTFFGPINGLALALQGPNNDVHGWRIHTAFVQEIDSAATDIYAGYSYNDGKAQGTSLQAAHLIIVGARIKF